MRNSVRFEVTEQIEIHHEHDFDLEINVVCICEACGGELSVSHSEQEGDDIKTYVDTCEACLSEAKAEDIHNGFLDKDKVISLLETMKEQEMRFMRTVNASDMMAFMASFLDFKTWMDQHGEWIATIQKGLDADLNSKGTNCEEMSNRIPNPWAKPDKEI